MQNAGQLTGLERSAINPMNPFDELFAASDGVYDQWNLTGIPFAESAEKLDKLNEVFTGRRQELGQVINLLRSQNAKSILVYGWVGIGKTAFVREVLMGLERNMKDTLTAVITLEPNTDLATAALIALARQLPDDDWAQYQLNRLGLRPGKPLRDRKTTAGADMVLKARSKNPPSPPNPHNSPPSAFRICWIAP